jgi:hypothetical protein
MRKFAIPVVAAVLASSGMALANVHSSRSVRGSKSHGKVIKVYAPTVQFARIDLGDPGFGLGDESAFSDDLLTGKGGQKVGYDGGTCSVVRVDNAATASGVLQCPVTFSLAGGQIATLGLVKLVNGQTTGTQVAAITGGTGRYRGARGEAAVAFISGTEANITFSIVG